MAYFYHLRPLSVLLAIAALIACKRRLDENESSYWQDRARLTLEKRLDRYPDERNNVARNAILFIGDGMGVPTVTAGRIYAGQKAARKNRKDSDDVGSEAYMTALDRMPVTGLAKTYSVDDQTPDSASTATAYLCGVKGNTATIGVNGKCKRGQCTSCGEDTYVWSILHRANQVGKWTGIVTNTRITHASPAAAYAHISERDWESFDGVKFKQQHYDEGCRDIAHQLVEHGSFINVAFGGGRRNFLTCGKSGNRVDGKDLISMWNSTMYSHHQGDRKKYKYIETLDQLQELDEASVMNVLGLFAMSHLPYQGTNESKETPTLSAMTAKAIKILSKAPKGFVLFVEGGLIDWAHHASQVGYAMEEFVNFENAIAEAQNLVNISNTHIVVSADHSHVFSLSGYATRGSDVLGFAIKPGFSGSDVDGMPMPIALYGNGPGYVETRQRKRPNFWKKFNESLQAHDLALKYSSAVPMEFETHGGEDVPIYSTGPGSNLYTGTMEQSTLAHVVAYSARIPPYDTQQDYYSEDVSF